MTLQQSRRLQSLLLGTLAWAIAILIFFPIFWMVLTSFKTEIDAFATPPQFIPLRRRWRTSCTSTNAAITSASPGTRW